MSGPQMGEIFLARQQYFGLKIEANPGTAETLSNADFKFLIENPKAKIVIKENTRKYAVGDPYAFTSVMGAQHMEFSGDIHFQGSGVNNAAPVAWTLLQTAGFTLPSATTLFYAAVLELPNSTATIEFQEKENAASSIRGKQYKMKGAAANKCTLHYDGAGQLQKMSITWIGALVGVTDLTAGSNAVPVLTTDVGNPPAVLSIVSTYGSLTLPTNAVTVDLGLKTNLVEYPPDPSGYSYAVISDLDPIINLKVLIQLEATLGVYAALTNTGTISKFTSSIGSGSTGTRIDIIMPLAQIVKGLDVEARDGIDEQPLMLRAIRNTASIDGFAVPLLALVMPIA